VDERIANHEFGAHLQVLLIDGGFRRDGTFVPLPPHDPAVLEEDAAAGMLAWPHSGFGAYVGPGIQERGPVAGGA